MLPIPNAAWNADKLADWVEYQILFGESGQLSRAELRDLIDEDMATADLEDYDSIDDFDEDYNDNLEDFGSPGRARRRLEVAEGTSESDELSYQCFYVLEQRAVSAGEGYPLRMAADLAEIRSGTWEDHLIYAFMVALNVRFTHRLSTETNRAARLFERLVTVAMASFVQGEAEHFGWPRDSPESGEKSFADVLPGVVQRMGERLSVAVDQIPKRLKDNEVDVFAWRPPSDGLRGQLVLLCQCAIGAGWDNKGIRLDKWDGLVVFAASPLCATAFPFVPGAVGPTDDGEYYEFLTKSVGLWFDRLRLAALAPRSSVSDELADRLAKYVRDLLQESATAA